MMLIILGILAGILTPLLVIGTVKLIIKVIKFILVRKHHLKLMLVHSDNLSSFINALQKITIPLDDLDNYRMLRTTDGSKWYKCKEFDPKIIKLEQEYFKESPSSKAIFIGNVNEKFANIAFIRTLGNELNSHNEPEDEVLKVMKKINERVGGEFNQYFGENLFHKHLQEYDFLVNYDFTQESNCIHITMLPSERFLPLIINPRNLQLTPVLNRGSLQAIIENIALLLTITWIIGIVLVGFSLGQLFYNEAFLITQVSLVTCFIYFYYKLERYKKNCNSLLRAIFSKI